MREVDQNRGEALRAEGRQVVRGDRLVGRHAIRLPQAFEGHRQVAVGGVADGTMAEATASVACDYAAIAPPVISAQVVKA